MTRLLIALKVVVLFGFLLAVGYPWLVTGFGRLFFSYQANGSLVMVGQETVGSLLIAQRFTSNDYFHSRPSDINYSIGAVKNENLTLEDARFYHKLQQRVEEVRMRNGFKVSKLPNDAVLASASGLDPHISIDNAMLQLVRVAGTRKLSKRVVERLVLQAVEKDFVGIWGSLAVNVLKLNLSLDHMGSSRK